MFMQQCIHKIIYSPLIDMSVMGVAIRMQADDLTHYLDEREREREREREKRQGHHCNWSTCNAFNEKTKSQFRSLCQWT